MLAAVHGWVGRHRVLVVCAWLVLVVAAVPLALRQSDRLTGGGFAVDGSASAKVEAAILRGIPVNYRPATLGVVLVAPRGTSRADYAAATRGVQRAVRGVRHVTWVSQNGDLAQFFARTRPGRPIVLPLLLDADEYHAPDVAKELRGRLGLDRSGGARFGRVQVHLVGAGALWAGMVDLTRHDLAHAERVGFPVVALILLLVFGALAAAVLPLAIGAVSIVVTGALTALLARHVDLTFYVPNTASMIGLGVAVDYSLFVVVRFREELRDGASAEIARAVAMRTSGTAVLFSGGAVVLALAALLLVPTAAVRSMAVGAIMVVLVAMLACSTLLPALLSLMGRRIGPAGANPGAFRRWGAVVVGHPRVALTGSLLVLLALAAPLLGIRTGDGALRQFPKGNETLAGVKAAQEVRGAGESSPLKVLVAPAVMDRSVAIVRRDPEVVRTGLRARTRDKKYIFLVVTPRDDPDSVAVKELVSRLRRELPRGSLVGGDTATQVDFNHAILGSLWKIGIWILVATFLLLFLMLRALPLALQAVLANVLSVGAALGVLTLIKVTFAGRDSYVDTVTIPVIMAVVFGLSMDYEVFLLSRIRERRLGGASTTEAVLEGIAGSAKTITGAALVMVAVFLCFALTGVPVITEIGLGAAVAILLDATLVRLILIPASMTLLGDTSWWSPHRRRRATTAA
jgi:RND superfamily putative drug exporter